MIYRIGYESDELVGSALTDMYDNYGNMEMPNWFLSEFFREILYPRHE